MNPVSEVAEIKTCPFCFTPIGSELRDEFAKAALIGEIARNTVGASLEFVAQRAYAMADAMMEAREKK